MLKAVTPSQREPRGPYVQRKGQVRFQRQLEGINCASASSVLRLLLLLQSSFSLFFTFCIWQEWSGALPRKIRIYTSTFSLISLYSPYDLPSRTEAATVSEIARPTRYANFFTLHCLYECVFLDWASALLFAALSVILNPRVSPSLFEVQAPAAMRYLWSRFDFSFVQLNFLYVFTLVHNSLIFITFSILWPVGVEIFGRTVII